MDRQLQDKLQQFSAPPPEGVWNKIADALDAEENFSQRLYQYEETPPAAVWQEIETNLDEAVPARVVRFRKQSRKPVNYAAVAAFLAAALITVSLLVRRTGAGAPDTATNSLVQTEQIQNLPPSAKQNESAGEEIHKPQNETTIFHTTTTPESQDGHAISSNRDLTSVSVENSNPPKKRLVYSPLNDYVLFSNGDGRVRKISKKLVQFINCKDNDLACKQRLRELRQTMAAKAMTTDFTGIVDLLRQIE